MKKSFNIKPGTFNKTGLLFSLIGFLLVICCFVGCLVPSGSGLYFAQVGDAFSNSSAIQVYYGMQGYCIQDGGLTCVMDRDLFQLPFDVSISNHLNTTYPRLFLDPISQDTSLNPGATPSPFHDPRIYPATVLQLLCSAVLITLCMYRIVSPLRYQDMHYTRGFLAAGSTVLGLTLLILSSIMYQNAITELTLVYPHLVAVEGPGMTMIGCSFASFFLAAFCLLRGCMTDDSNIDTDGYNPL